MFTSAPPLTAAASPGRNTVVYPAARLRPLLLSHLAAAAVVIYRCVAVISGPGGSVQVHTGALRPGAVVIPLPVYLHGNAGWDGIDVI